jgi:lipopolysaccharide cholinephosphotransferase
MNEFQKILFDLFIVVIDALEKENIPYFMSEGTCLGTIRHSGFIPWDDDIDIAIYSDSYEHFINTIPKILGDRYEVVGAFDQHNYPEYTDIMTKIVDKKYNLSFNVFPDGRQFHPWIDVQLICGLPGGKIASNLFFTKILVNKALLKISNIDSIGFNSPKKRGFVEKGVLEFVRKHDFSKFLDEEKQSVKCKKALLKYSSLKSRYVVGFSSDYRYKEILKREVFGEGVKKEFEGTIVNVPSDYDSYLRRLYGEYTELPPIEKRIGSHIVENLICNEDY